MGLLLPGTPSDTRKARRPARRRGGGGGAGGLPGSFGPPTIQPVPAPRGWRRMARQVSWLRICLLPDLPARTTRGVEAPRIRFRAVAVPVSSPVTVAGAAPDSHRLPSCGRRAPGGLPPGPLAVTAPSVCQRVPSHGGTGSESEAAPSGLRRRRSLGRSRGLGRRRRRSRRLRDLDDRGRVVRLGAAPERGRAGDEVDRDPLRLAGVDALPDRVVRGRRGGAAGERLEQLRGRVLLVRLSRID